MSSQEPEPPYTDAVFTLNLPLPSVDPPRSEPETKVKEITSSQGEHYLFFTFCEHWV